MNSDDSPSRMPAKRTTTFVARGRISRATQSYPETSSPGGGTRRKRRRRPVVRIRREWVVAALMGTVLLVTVIGLWVMGRMNSTSGDKGDIAATRTESSAARPEKWHGPVPAVIAERFTKAKTQEERLELIRNPAQVGPAMEAFFKEGPGASERITGSRAVATGSSGDLFFEAYSVEIENAPPRLLSVTVEPQGAKVDFECYARLGSVGWDDLLTGKVTEAAEVRVILQPGGYYLHEFSDEKKWLHFKVTSPDLTETLDFYLDREHPSAREIQEIRTPVFRATLSVRAVNGSEKHRQFQITGVKALEWVEPG